MFFHGDREVRAALHRRIVRDDETLASLHASDASDDPRPRRFIVVHPVRRERGQLEKRRGRIKQFFDALANENLPLLAMPLQIFLAAPLPRFRETRIQIMDERLEPFVICFEIVRGGVEM